MSPQEKSRGRGVSLKSTSIYQGSPRPPGEQANGCFRSGQARYEVRRVYGRRSVLSLRSSRGRGRDAKWLGNGPDHNGAERRHTEAAWLHGPPPLTTPHGHSLCWPLVPLDRHDHTHLPVTPALGSPGSLFSPLTRTHLGPLPSPLANLRPTATRPPAPRPGSEPARALQRPRPTPQLRGTPTRQRQPSSTQAGPLPHLQRHTQPSAMASPTKPGLVT